MITKQSRLSMFVQTTSKQDYDVLGQASLANIFGLMPSRVAGIRSL